MRMRLCRARSASRASEQNSRMPLKFELAKRSRFCELFARSIGDVISESPVRPTLNRKCSFLGASFWLALSWLVLISPSLLHAEQWNRLDDARQPAAQAASSIGATAARPQVDDGAPFTLQAESEAPHPVSRAKQYAVAAYRCDFLARFAAFEPRAPPDT